MAPVSFGLLYWLKIFILVKIFRIKLHLWFLKKFNVLFFNMFFASIAGFPFWYQNLLNSVFENMFHERILYFPRSRFLINWLVSIIWKQWS